MENIDESVKKALVLTKDNKVIVSVPYIRVYIPSDYFEHGISEIIGSDVNTFGIFKFDAYGLDSKKFNEENPFTNPTRFVIEFPMMIKMSPSSIYEERDNDKNLITVLEFVQNDLFMNTINFVRTWKNIAKMLDLLLKGFLPKTLTYERVVGFMNECCALNGKDYGVADTIEEIMVAELYRDPKNLSRAFRLALADNPNLKFSMAQAVKMDTLGRMQNTFAAISSGDPKQGITMSINRENYNEKQSNSSIEDVLTDV